MSESRGKNILVIIRSLPFSGAKVSEALRMSVGLTIHDDPLCIFFVDDGVFALGQSNPGKIDLFPVDKHIEMLSELKREIYYDVASAKARGVKPAFKARKSNLAGLAGLIGGSSTVITC